MLAIQIAGKKNGIAQTKGLHFLLERPHGGAVTDDDKQDIGPHPAGMEQGLKQKADVFFVGYPADKKGHRPCRKYSVTMPERPAISAGKTLDRNAGRQDMQRRTDTIGFETLAHGG